jgi:hypothetical protein
LTQLLFLLALPIGVRVALFQKVPQGPDVVIQAFALDIDESPYVYMEEIKLHHGTFKGAQK